MTSHRKRILVSAGLLALVFLLVASLWLNYVQQRRYHVFRDGNPPRSVFVGGKCDRTGLVGHWRFEEIAGSDAKTTADASGRANHARLHVVDRPLARLRFGLPEQVAGVDGKAMEVRGRHWLTVGNNDCFTTDRFTFASWIWLGETALVPTIAGKSAWPHSGWWLMTTTKGIQPEDRYLDLGILWPGGSAHVKSGYQLPLREWHHVVVTVDNDAREVAFFVDGKPLSRHRNVPKWHVNWDHELVLGDYDGTTRWPWIGKLDDMRFYNTVLSPDESVALYSAAPKPNP